MCMNYSLPFLWEIVRIHKKFECIRQKCIINKLEHELTFDLPNLYVLFIVLEIIQTPSHDRHDVSWHSLIKIRIWVDKKQRQLRKTIILRNIFWFYSPHKNFNFFSSKFVYNLIFQVLPTFSNALSYKLSLMFNSIIYSNGSILASK